MQRRQRRESVTKAELPRGSSENIACGTVRTDTLIQ
jgi:hypothetical protein